MKKCILFCLVAIMLFSCERKEVTTYDDVLNKGDFGFSLTDNQLDQNVRSQMKGNTPTFYFEKIDSSRYLLYTYGSPDEIYELYLTFEDRIVFRSYFGEFEFHFDKCKALKTVVQKVFRNDSLGIKEVNLFYNL